MAYLGDIARRLKKQLGTEIAGQYDEDMKIDYIQLRGKPPAQKPGNVEQNKGIIYVGGWNLHQKPPKGCCAVVCPGQASREIMVQVLPENVLCLDRAFDIMDIYETVQDEILSYVQFNEHKEQMFMALQGSGGIRGILQTAFTFLENPICVCDTSFSIIENYPDHENVLDFEIRNHRQYMKPSSVMSMNREGLIQRIFTEEKPFCVFRRELDTFMMYYAIRIHKNAAGYICILERSRKFTKRDEGFVAVLSQMLSVEMQKNSFFAEKAGLKYEYFLTDLVEGNYNNPDEIRQRMHQLGYKNGKYHWVMVLAMENIFEGHVSNEYFIDQLMTILSNALATFYRGNILVLISSDNGRAMEEGELVKLKEFAALNHMVMAVSYGFLNLNEMPVYYEQAEELARYGKDQGFWGRIVRMEEYCLEALVWNRCRPAARQAMIHPDLKYLEDYDRENHTEYLKTLYAYLECGRSAVDAAKQLNIHKSSFFYRFNKICRLLKLDPRDAKKLFMYEFSMGIREKRMEGEK